MTYIIRVEVDWGYIQDLKTTNLFGSKKERIILGDKDKAKTFETEAEANEFIKYIKQRGYNNDFYIEAKKE